MNFKKIVFFTNFLVLNLRKYFFSQLFWYEYSDNIIFVQELISVKEQLLRELDMYQEIAVSRGGEYDRLNQNMDRCQENIETLSDEIQRLQGIFIKEKSTLKVQGMR